MELERQGDEQTDSDAESLEERNVEITPTKETKRKRTDTVTPPRIEEFFMAKKGVQEGPPEVLCDAQGLNKLRKTIETLQRYATLNPNTKVEIKRGIKEASGVIKNLINQNRLRIEIGRDSVAKAEQNRAGVEIATQTDRETAKPTKKASKTWDLGGETEEERARKLAEEISKADYESFQKTAGVRWPENMYKIVEEAEGNPIWEVEEKDLAFCAGREDKWDRGISRQFKLRFPDLVQQEADQGKNGLSYIRYEVSTPEADEPERKKTRLVYKILIEESEENTYDNMLNLRRAMEKNRRCRIALPISMPQKWERLKKMLESVFAGSGIRVVAYCPKKREGQLNTASPLKQTVNARKTQVSKLPGSGTVATNPKRKEFKTEATIVTTKGGTYAELLRRVKGEVDIDHLGVQIKGVRKTRKGELLLETVRGSDAGEKLRKAISEKLGERGVEVRGLEKSKNMVLHIRGLDGATTLEETELALKTFSGDQELTVKSIRQAFGGNQNATVITSRETGRKMLSTGRVRIGWAICRVHERIEVDQCARCWGIGHFANGCTGVDRGRQCRKCGEEGHKAIECQGTPYCPICNEKGHRADTALCPRYREALGKNAGCSRASSLRITEKRAGIGKKDLHTEEETSKASTADESRLTEAADNIHKENG